MKSVIKVIIGITCAFLISTNVYAEASYYIEGEGSDSNNLVNKFKSSDKTSVSSANTTVTLYGKSVCNGSSCTVTYALSGNSSFKDALAKAVTCSNGENYITYNDAHASGKEDFDENNKQKLSGTAYWSEDYFVTCTESNSGTSVIMLSNSSSSSSSSSSSTVGSSSSGASESGNASSTGSSNSSSSSSESGYSSGSTVSNEQTGVSTYFIVLGLVAVISYIFMICVKKFNLFKNI